jgi:integrase
MRYIEAQRFQNTPSWFDGDFINLPSSASLKVKAKQRERSIRLNQLGKQIIPFFLNSNVRLPSRQTWRENLRRWGEKAGLGDDFLSPKSLRKTWESWLSFYYPDRVLEITLSQGHTSITSVRHYLNLSFTEEDKMLMKDFVGGWI